MAPSATSSHNGAIYVLALPLLFLIFHLLGRGGVLLVGVRDINSGIGPTGTILFACLVCVFCVKVS